MRTLYLTLALLIGGAMDLPGTAQDCSLSFTTPLFDVQQEMDVFYGTAVRFNGAVDSLRMNIYKPVGDGQTERPLVLLIHGGGFTGGHRNDLNSLCQEMASMGWATATISYRLDFYGTWLLSSPWAYDAAEVVRAAYRAQQDARGAVRFLRERSAQDSTSVQNVMLWGFSAGAITAIHAAFVDDPAEKPASCEAIGDVMHTGNSYPRPDLGPIEGTLNVNGQSDEVLGVASFFGGFLDTAMISAPLDPALYLYHQTGDPVVGCDHQQGLWGMPLGVGANYPWLYGSCVTDMHIQTLNPAPGRYQYHQHSGNQHAVHAPTSVYLEAREFLRELFCGVNTQIAELDMVDLRVSPIPSSGLIRVDGQADDRVLETTLMDLSGRMLSLEAGHGRFPFELDLSDRPDGVYILRVSTENGQATHRIVIAR
ncbi:MAG: carboxylesterase family protein [Flavobacteriales bacterium]|nr:carboxylesterase family protein [Flavobacteriales bacterium]